MSDGRDPPGAVWKRRSRDTEPAPRKAALRRVAVSGEALTPAARGLLFHNTRPCGPYSFLALVLSSVKWDKNCACLTGLLGGLTETVWAKLCQLGLFLFPPRWHLQGGSGEN